MKKEVKILIDANQFRRYVKMDSSKISLFTSVVGNGATWGKLEPKIKVKKKKNSKNFEFCLRFKSASE